MPFDDTIKDLLKEFEYYSYRISGNSLCGNYSFLKVGVPQLFKGGNYSREETILFYFFLRGKNYIFEET